VPRVFFFNHVPRVKDRGKIDTQTEASRTIKTEHCEQIGSNFKCEQNKSCLCVNVRSEVQYCQQISVRYFTWSADIPNS
jgi:hypothetical protein